MAAKLITYDLNKETVRPKIVTAIKELGGWARLSESSYATNSSLTPDQIYEKLDPLIDADDDLFVITLTHPYMGYGDKRVIAWLGQNLSA